MKRTGSVRRRPAPAKRLLLLPLLLAAVAGCRHAGPPSYQVTLAGSQVAVELVDSWLHDARDVRFGVEMLWPRTYAQIGFAKLAAGECAIACTDRPLTPRELAQFNGRRPVGYRVGFYGFALYVNRSNPLDAIYAGHLEMLLQGKLTDWQQLGGKDLPNLGGPIRVLGKGKGSRAGLHLAHLARIWFAEPTWEETATDEQIITAVAADPLALGFAGIGYDDNESVRYLGLRMERTGRPAFPSLEEIESERYGLAKVLYVYYIDPPTPAVSAVLDYLFGPAGQAVLAETEVWPIARDRALVRPPQP